MGKWREVLDGVTQINEGGGKKKRVEPEEGEDMYTQKVQIGPEQQKVEFMQLIIGHGLDPK